MIPKDDIASRREIEQASAELCMDLATLAFYTDFLFTKESRLFRFKLGCEPDGQRVAASGRVVSTTR